MRYKTKAAKEKSVCAGTTRLRFPGMVPLVPNAFEPFIVAGEELEGSRAACLAERLLPAGERHLGTTGLLGVTPATRWRQ